MPQKAGSITLTHMLNRRGRIELETTIVKMGEGRYYLVCAAFFEQRLLDHLAKIAVIRMSPSRRSRRTGLRCH
jgi:dimethylglycine dehydrogenase